MSSERVTHKKVTNPAIKSALKSAIFDESSQIQFIARQKHLKNESKSPLHSAI